MVATPMIQKNDFAGKLKKAVDAVVEAKTGELVARLEDLQRVLDGEPVISPKNLPRRSTTWMIWAKRAFCWKALRSS